jgi:hypothetical protein
MGSINKAATRSQAEASPETCLAAARDELDYLHVDRLSLPRRLSAAAAFSVITGDPPAWLRLAFRVRDAVSGLFGVAPIEGFGGATSSEPRPGDKMGFFLVEKSAPDQLVLTSRDRHLDVMICVNARHEGEATDLVITASVKTHNRFGRAYMLAVGPVHRVLSAYLGRRAQRGLSAA